MTLEQAQRTVTWIKYKQLNGEKISFALLLNFVQAAKVIGHRSEEPAKKKSGSFEYKKARYWI